MFDIRILTVRQPYASAMFFGPSPKDDENRSKPPPKDLIGKRLYIHAGEALELDGLRLCRNLGFDPLNFGDLPILPSTVRLRLREESHAANTFVAYPPALPLPHGVILGSVLLDGYSRESDSPWRDRAVEFGWILRDPQPLARPVPVPGGGQLTHGWRPSEDVAALLLEQEFGRAA